MATSVTLKKAGKSKSKVLELRESGAFMHSIEVAHIQYLVDVVLDQMNESSSHKINWVAVSENLVHLRSNFRWSPIVCQKVSRLF
jgi:hypothetical protein